MTRDEFLSKIKNIKGIVFEEDYQFGVYWYTLVKGNLICYICCDETTAEFGSDINSIEISDHAPMSLNLAFTMIERELNEHN